MQSISPQKAMEYSCLRKLCFIHSPPATSSAIVPAVTQSWRQHETRERGGARRTTTDDDGGGRRRRRKKNVHARTPPLPTSHLLWQPAAGGRRVLLLLNAAAPQTRRGGAPRRRSGRAAHPAHAHTAARCARLRRLEKMPARTTHSAAACLRMFIGLLQAPTYRFARPRPFLLHKRSRRVAALSLHRDAPRLLIAARLVLRNGLGSSSPRARLPRWHD